MLLDFIFVSNGWVRPWRLVLFGPLFLAALGLIQAHEKTCAVLAEMGLRNLDNGEVKIQDGAIAERLRTRGRMIWVKSAVVAAALTLLFFVYP